MFVRPLRLLALLALAPSGCDERAPGPPAEPQARLRGVAWTAESDQAGAIFGDSVASAGDVNGDGYDDVVIGAHFYDGGHLDEGRAYLYLGSATGLAAAPAWTAESDELRAYFGIHVGSAGDVNGDGYADVVVSALGTDNGHVDEGRAHLYLGSAAGLAATPAWTAEGEQTAAALSRAVTAGDVNGDGYGDVVVGAFDYDGGEIDEGRAFLYLGSAAGLSPTPAWTAESDQVDANFGYAVASAGDVNGDGYGDVVVGATGYDGGQKDEGRVYVYLGSAAGLAAAPAWTAESDQPSALFGTSVASAGDVDGDGYGDLIVGAHSWDAGTPDSGQVSVYLGSAAGLALTPAWTAESRQGASYLGWSAASAGDLNGDGYGDVVAGAPYFDGRQPNAGRISLFFGSAAGLAAIPEQTQVPGQAYAYFGRSVASAGDVDGDGYPDLLAGAGQADHGEIDEGVVVLFAGGPTDADADGSDTSVDCDDADPATFPGAPDPLGDGADQDCDGLDG